MIARLWLPLQLHRNARAIALGAGVLVAWSAGPLEGIVVLALVAGALAFSLSARHEGHYAYAAGTGYLWLAGQLALVGAIPDAGLFGSVLLALAAASVGVIPFTASRARGRADGRQIVLAPPQSSGWVLIAIGVAAGAGFGLASRTSPNFAPADVGQIWPWALGWLAIWAAWRQSIRESVPFAVALAALCFYAESSGSAPSALSVGVSLNAALAIRLASDQRAAAGWTCIAVAAAIIGGALLDARSLPVGAGAAFVVWGQLRLPRSSASGGARARLSAALKCLPPYPRWYATAKLGSDPLFERVQDKDGLRGSVLDIGCGMALAGALKSVSVPGSYIGLDIDPEKLRAGARLLDSLANGDEVELRLADLRDWAPARRFDRVLLLDVLHYASAVEQQEMLRAAAGMIADDGRLLVRDPVRGAATGVARGERWTTFFGLNPVGATAFLDRDLWEEAFLTAGLIVESEHEFPDGNVLFVLSHT